jgi:hypothetical protein
MGVLVLSTGGTYCHERNKLVCRQFIPLIVHGMNTSGRTSQMLWQAQRLIAGSAKYLFRRGFAIDRIY